ncbi:MAG: hypothetical protein Q8920_02730 [Bacillota bacterium]|nr:hypothetical protein [Bacillota bacterium]
MEDKAFELLTQMYSDFSKRFDKVENEISDIKTDVSGLKVDVSSLKKTVLHIEQDHGNKLDILLDVNKMNTDKRNEIERKVDKLTNKVDQHEIRIKVIEGGRK